MEVDPATAAGAWPQEEHTYFFCSVGCLARFKADPAGVLAVAPQERTMDPGTGG
jgi:YHS domain-containing protein